MLKNFSNIGERYMESLYGLSIVTCDTVNDFIQVSQVSAWQKLEESLKLKDYLKRDLSPQQQKELRFAPSVEVIRYLDPSRVPFTGFRTHLKDFVTVFTFLPHPQDPQKFYVPIVVEWKHGSEEISFVPPSGVPNKDEGCRSDGLHVCAKREFEEETGIVLDSVVPLFGEKGIPVSSRNQTQRCFPFIGVPRQPIVTSQRKLDRHEFIETVLFPIEEWEKFILFRDVGELASIAITHLAVNRLRRTV